MIGWTSAPDLKVTSLDLLHHIPQSLSVCGVVATEELLERLGRSVRVARCLYPCGTPGISYDERKRLGIITPGHGVDTRRRYKKAIPAIPHHDA